MKKLLVLLLFTFWLVCSVRAVSILHLHPKEECDLSRPVKRSPLMAPIIGIERNKLFRLRNTDCQTYEIEILQDERVVCSLLWNANEEELILPSDLEGEYEFVLSDGIKKYIGTLYIDNEL